MWMFWWKTTTTTSSKTNLPIVLLNKYQVPVPVSNWWLKESILFSTLLHSSPSFSFSKFKKCTDYRPSLHLFWRGEKLRILLLCARLLGLMARQAGRQDKTTIQRNHHKGYSSFGSPNCNRLLLQLWCSYCSCWIFTVSCTKRLNYPTSGSAFPLKPYV